MKRISIAATALIVWTASWASAAEKPVRIENGGRGLAAVLNLPDGVKNPPVVLMLHGFTGQKEEFPIAARNIGLFTYAAKKLAEQGIATLRVDFNGSGESAGKWEDTTFSGQIGDAVLAFDYAQALPEVDGRRVGILGYSQGGLVGSHLAALRPEASAVVLWAPVTNPIATYTTILGKEAIEKGLSADASQLITTKLSWGGETTLKAGFFKELAVYNPVGAISKYNGPLRVVVGKRETIVAPQPAAGQILLNYHDGIEDLVEIDSDHDWNAEKAPETAEQVLVPKTAEWFEKYL